MTVPTPGVLDTVPEDVVATTTQPSGGSLWPPDWSQFVPDLVGSILVGAIVSVVVGRYLHGIEQRSAKRAQLERYTDDWEALQPRLLAALQRPSRHPMASFEEVPDRLQAVDDLCAPVPLATWARALPGERNDIRTVIDLVQKINVSRTTGAAADIDLSELVRRHNHNRRIDPVNDIDLRDYIRARLLGDSPEQAARFGNLKELWAEQKFAEILATGLDVSPHINARAQLLPALMTMTAALEYRAKYRQSELDDE